jgi:hypothetical protein
MNLSSFDAVAKLVRKLRALEAARDAVQFNPMSVTVSGRGGDGDVNIADITSPAECRLVIITLLDQNIAETRTALWCVYGVKVDE